MKISIKTTVNAPIERVWSTWTSSDDITKWNFASDEWCCPKAKIDLKQGGRFSYRMEAKDGSMGFDFDGKFVAIDTNKKIIFTLGDNRMVEVTFVETADGITLTETFEAEDENSAEQQKQGWQCILNNFKAYVEQNL